MNNEGYAWVFRARSGQYLAPGGPPADGTPLVGQNEPFAWDIYPDEQDNSIFKCVVLSPIYLPPDCVIADRGARRNRILLPNTPFAVDLSDHGNPEPGTPVVIWFKWEGKNQAWRFEQV